MLITLGSDPTLGLKHLQRATELLQIARLSADLLCEATMWRTMRNLQSVLHLHAAALHSAGMSAGLYERAGRHDLTQMMREAYVSVLFSAGMYAEMRVACTAQLAQPSKLPLPLPMLLRVMHPARNGAAVAAYCMGTQTQDADQRDSLWQEAIQHHKEALALLADAKKADHTALADLSRSNLATLYATLGQLEWAQSMWQASVTPPAILAQRPSWEANRRLHEGLIAAETTATAKAG